MDEGRDGLDPRDAELARRAREAFEREAEALDAATRQRLGAARRAAIEELEARLAGAARRSAPAWLPAGAAAAVAVAAVGVALTVRGPQPAPVGAPGGDAAEPATEMELLLGEDDLGMFAEDPEFVAWAVEEGAAAAAPEGADDAG